VWRTDGVAWTRVVSGGFGDANNLVVSALAAFGGQLYAAAGNLATGIEMWRSATGNASSWSQVNADGFGAGPTWENAVLDVYSNHLYTGFSRQVSGKGRAELWRTANGTTWTPVFTDGLGNSNNADVASLAAFRGQLYVGLRNPSTGGEVWRAGDGLSFSPVFTGGLGNAANRGAYGLIEFEDQLYAVFSNVGAGAEVWRTSDGAAWSRIGQGGWGDNDNRFADYFDKGAAIFEDRLYIGTLNDAAGGQIWLLLSRPAYLPIIRREDAQR